MKFKTFNQVFRRFAKKQKALFLNKGCFHNQVGFKNTKRDQCNLRYFKLSKLRIATKTKWKNNPKCKIF